MSQFPRGTYVRLLDHEEVPFAMVGKLGIIEDDDEGYLDLFVFLHDQFGERIPIDFERYEDILVVPHAAVQPLSPLEQLAMASED